MRKQVSTPFAIIVIVFALAVGGLYFLWQLRAYDAAQKAEAAMLQRQADAARRSGRGQSGGGRMPGMGRGMRGGLGAKAPGMMPGGPAAGGKAPAAKPEKGAPAKPAAAEPAPAKAAPTKTEKK